MKTLLCCLTLAISSSTLAFADDPAAKKPTEPGKVNAPEAAGKPVADPRMNTKEGKIFRAYDKDESGTVSAEEIEAMIERDQNARGRREIRKAVKTADSNGDEQLSFDEFGVWRKLRAEG